MKIRLLKKDEIDSVYKIVQENYVNENWIKDAYEELKSMFSNSKVNPEYYVVEIDKKIIGFAGFCQSWMDYDIYEFFWVNVKPEFQGKGIGKFLISQLIEIIKKKKGARLILLSSNLIDFYSKLDFKSLNIFDVDGYKLMYLDLKK